MKRLRCVVLVHKDLIPPDSIEGYTEAQIDEWRSEFDVVDTLRTIGHEVRPIGLVDELTELRDTILEWQPHVAFNLLEEFHSVATYDQHVVSYLELMKQPYTGCNPRGLLLSHDKVLSKKILTYHRIHTPKFSVYRPDCAIRPSRKLQYPLFVKSAVEDASLGISQASIVHNDKELVDRVEFVHQQTRDDALVEEYIEGRELYVGVVGNQRLTTLPIWEMAFTKMPEHIARIATRKVKWDRRYQEKHGIMTDQAKDLGPPLEQNISRLCKRVFRVLQMSGCARMDLRLRPDGTIYVLEANANPNLAYGEDFAESADKAGINYQTLIQRIVNLGIAYKAAWRE